MSEEPTSPHQHHLIALPKSLDVMTVGPLEKETLRLDVKAGQDLILDMSAVEYVSSAGIRFLLMANSHWKKGGQATRIAGMCSNVEQTLKVCHLLHHFQVFATVEDAVQSDSSSS